MHLFLLVVVPFEVVPFRVLSALTIVGQVLWA